MRKALTPEQAETAHKALLAVRAKFLTQQHMADELGVSQASVCQWLRNRKVLSAESVLAVETATGVSRHLLRPDLWPAPNAWHGVDRGTDRVSFNRNSGLQANVQERAA